VAKIKIVTDSACDLSPQLAEQSDVTVVPLSIRFGDHEYTDRVELTPTQFWDLCRSAKELPETAAPSPGAFAKAYDEAKEAGYDGVVAINLSAALSGTYQSARTAADSRTDGFPVTVIDSKAVTMAQGLVVLVAADLAKSGADLNTITEAIESAISRTHVLGVLDTLDHLVKGGRVGGAKGLLGSVLSIKPILELRDGVVEEESKQRTRSRALKYLVDKIRTAGPFERVAIVHGDASDLSVVTDMLADVDLGTDLVISDLGPVVGTHGGPGLIGVCYLTAK
jgi:DegV family protein with EDD domain